MLKPKFIHLLFINFAFLISCNKDDNKVVICQLSKLGINNGTNIYSYTYEYTDGKLSTYTFSPGVVSKFNYGSNGLVTSIEDSGGTREITYDGNRPSLVTRKQQSNIIETLAYKWGDNSLKIEYTPMGLTSPIAIENIEFINENIIRKFVTVYDQTNLSKVNLTNEEIYSDYDKNTNPYYLPTGMWFEYPYPISKNNYKSLVIKRIVFSNGVPQTPENFTYTLNYKFNSSNVISELTKTLTSGGNANPRVETFTYSNCN
jgi:hypothetical protein